MQVLTPICRTTNSYKNFDRADKNSVGFSVTEHPKTEDGRGLVKVSFTWN